MHKMHKIYKIYKIYIISLLTFNSHFLLLFFLDLFGLLRICVASATAGISMIAVANHLSNS